MKLPIILILSLFTVMAIPTNANDMTQSFTNSLQKSTTNKAESSALTSYAASKLGMSKDTVTSGLGSIFKVAKDKLPVMLKLATSYLDKNGYGEASGLLKKGLSFL